MRDPRINPLPGDRVRLRKRTRLITRVNRNGIYFKIEEQANAHEKNCWHVDWWDWCTENKVEVVEIGQQAPARFFESNK